MGDAWSPKTPRSQRRSRALGTIDGRLLSASPVVREPKDKRPDSNARLVLFNSGGPVNDGSLSPPYIVSYDCTLTKVTATVADGSIIIYVIVDNNNAVVMRASSPSNPAIVDDLDIAIDDDSRLMVIFEVVSGTPTDAVATVTLLED